MFSYYSFKYYINAILYIYIYINNIYLTLNLFLYSQLSIYSYITDMRNPISQTCQHCKFGFVSNYINISQNLDISDTWAPLRY